jgi:hypothetical protein
MNKAPTYTYALRAATLSRSWMVLLPIILPRNFTVKRFLY